MKRIFAMIILFCLTFSLAACSSGAGSSPSVQPEESAEPTSAETPDITPAPTPEPTPDPAPPREPAAVEDSDIWQIFNRNTYVRIARLGEHYYFLSSYDGELYRCNPDGSEPEPVENSGDGGYSGLILSGGWLFWLSGGVLYRMEEGGIPEALFRNVRGPFFVSGERVYFGDYDLNILLECDLASGGKRILEPEGFDPNRRYAVLGDILFYFAKGETGEYNEVFRSYDLITEEVREEYPGEHNYFESFALDREYFYLQIAESVENEGSEDKLVVVDRATGETVQSWDRIVRHFYVLDGTFYAITQSGLARMDDEGNPAQTISPSPWFDVGLNFVDGYFFIYDTNDEFDSLIRPDGTGKIEFQR